MIAMPRPIWLCFVGLLLLGALFALRASIFARTIVGSTDASLASAVDEGPPFFKSDRLPSFDLDRLESKARVTTVKIAPAPREAKALAGTAKALQAAGVRKEVTSWHWRAGSGIKRGTMPGGQPKSDR